MAMPSLTPGRKAVDGSVGAKLTAISLIETARSSGQAKGTFSASGRWLSPVAFSQRCLTISPINLAASPVTIA